MSYWSHILSVCHRFPSYLAFVNASNRFGGTFVFWGTSEGRMNLHYISTYFTQLPHFDSASWIFITVSMNNFGWILYEVLPKHVTSDFHSDRY
jgi:hypothetical protein